MRCAADTLRLLAAVHAAIGQLPTARELAAEALQIAREVGDRRVEAHAILAQADLDLRTGDSDPAVARLQQVLVLARGDGARHAEAQARISLARAHRLRDGTSTAQSQAYAQKALSICREFGYEMLERDATAALAEPHPSVKAASGEAGNAKFPPDLG